MNDEEPERSFCRGRVQTSAKAQNEKYHIKRKNPVKQLTNLDPCGKILNTAYYGRRFRAAQVIYSAPRSESIIKEG